MHTKLCTVFTAPIRFGLEDINQPIEGARPAFLIPPQLGRLVIEAAFRAMRDPFISTMIYNTKTLLFFINRK
jgi:hypothetical protein